MPTPTTSRITTRLIALSLSRKAASLRAWCRFRFGLNLLVEQILQLLTEVVEADNRLLRTLAVPEVHQGVAESLRLNPQGTETSDQLSMSIRRRKPLIIRPRAVDLVGFLRRAPPDPLVASVQVPMHVQDEIEGVDFQFPGRRRSASCSPHLVDSRFERAQITEDDKDRYHQHDRQGAEPNPQPFRRLETLLRAV
jgi:hypothetical protein